MISYLRGKIIDTEVKFVVLDVCGVGYKIWTNEPPLETDSEASFFTYLSVRENSLELYGFAKKTDLSLFELLLSVSGIGPKSAMSILSNATVETICLAVRNNDSAILTKMSGIGRKNAEKIVLELQGKIDGFQIESGEISHQSDAIDALLSLGYSEKDIRNVLKNIKAQDRKEIIKDAIKALGK